MFKKWREARGKDPRKVGEKGPRRNDGARDSQLGDPGGLPGSGADLASQDMEVPSPS